MRLGIDVGISPRKSLNASEIDEVDCRTKRTGCAPSFLETVHGEVASPCHVSYTHWARAGESFESLPF